MQVVILAAGRGQRMQSRLPKVLHTLAGQPLLQHVLSTAHQISNDKPIVVTGSGRELLQAQFAADEIIWATQEQQLGTGHALQQALPLITGDRVLVLYGDVPLISVSTLANLIAATPANAIGMITASMSNPRGYGRIVRNALQQVSAIIEEKDADSETLLIQEINSGIYLFPLKFLKSHLPKLKNHNQQHEYYLTDLIVADEAMSITTVNPSYLQEIQGVNDRSQLATLERFYQLQQAERFMQQGVTLMDPARFDVRGKAIIAKDVRIDVNVILIGDVEIGEGTEIGPNCIIRDTKLGANCSVRANTIIEGAQIADRCTLGPYARVRPESTLAEAVHIGNFVEIKKSDIGQHSKINHLTYIGDCQMGARVNIGAGTITCNYDGFNKHKTIIGDDVQVGSDSTLVAPITIADHVFIATATTVRKDVPAGALVYNRREELVRTGWMHNYIAKQQEK